MAKSLREARLTTRNARAALNVGLHWRSIDPDVHLGYRKNVRGGKWLVRWYEGDQKYRQSTIGTADDVLTEGTLSFEAAVKSARIAVTESRRAFCVATDQPMPTVGDIVRDYIAHRDHRTFGRTGREIRSDASYRLGRHVLTDMELCAPPLGSMTETNLKAWRQRLDPHLKSTTVRRLINDLKAALNGAYQEHRKRLPPDFAETIRQGLRLTINCDEVDTVARDNQILSDQQVRSIIEAAIRHDADGDLARMVIVLAATGARFSQIQRMQVRDVQFAQTRLLVPTSRKGKGRVAGHITVQVGLDVLARLKPVVEDRDLGDALLCRWRHVQIGAGKWDRASRGPWQTASEMIRPWRTVCEAAGLPGTVPYALRHSSIVRGIRAGLPIRLVAALHDTSVVMIERHYARWITDGLEELAARAVVPLVPS